MLSAFGYFTFKWRNRSKKKEFKIKEAGLSKNFWPSCLTTDCCPSFYRIAWHGPKSMHWFLWLQFFPASLENNFWHFKLTEAVCVGSLVTSAWLNLGNSVLFLSSMFLLLFEAVDHAQLWNYERWILPRQSHPSLKPLSAHFEYVGGGVSLPLIRSFPPPRRSIQLTFIIHHSCTSEYVYSLGISVHCSYLCSSYLITKERCLSSQIWIRLSLWAKPLTEKLCERHVCY